jgi:hypothetical protein
MLFANRKTVYVRLLSSFLFSFFLFISSSQCWTQAVDQVKLTKPSDFLFSL